MDLQVMVIEIIRPDITKQMSHENYYSIDNMSLSLPSKVANQTPYLRKV